MTKLKFLSALIAAAMLVTPAMARHMSPRHLRVATPVAVKSVPGQPTQAELDRDMRENPDHSVPVWQRNTNGP
jgi:hypothetical protein